MEVLPYYHSFSSKAAHNVVAELSEKTDSLAPTPALCDGRVTISGSEANDTAFKLVRYYHNAIGAAEEKDHRPQQGYHGVTVATACYPAFRRCTQHFDLPIDGVLRVSCPHPTSLQRMGESPEQFATRLAEELEALIQKEGADTIGGSCRARSRARAA